MGVSVAEEIRKLLQYFREEMTTTLTRMVATDMERSEYIP